MFNHHSIARGAGVLVMAVPLVCGCAYFESKEKQPEPKAYARTKVQTNSTAKTQIARLFIEKADGKRCTMRIGPIENPVPPTPSPAASIEKIPAMTDAATKPTLPDCGTEIINGWVFMTGWYPCARTRHVQAAGQHTTIIVEANPYASGGGFDRVYLLWNDSDSLSTDSVIIYDLAGKELLTLDRNGDAPSGERYVKIMHSTMSVTGPFQVDDPDPAVNRRTFVNAIFPH
jgi:hypothetical protein